MDEVGARVSGTDRGSHLILYDGVCGLCNRLSQFVLRHDYEATFDFASLQSGAGQAILLKFGKNTEILSTFYIVKDYWSESPALLDKADAALFLMETLNVGRAPVDLLRKAPRGLLDFVYQLVARNRYRLFGRTEECLTPNPEFKKRFIDL